MTDYLGIIGLIVVPALVIAVLTCATITTLSSIIPPLMAVMVGIVGAPLTGLGYLMGMDRLLVSFK